jgi:hypothetical protein
VIDRVARGNLAELLRRTADGDLGSEEFERLRPRSRDRAVREIVGQARLLFADRKASSETSGRLSGDDRRDVSRWTQFLESDREYAWPVLPLWATLLGAIPNLLTFGLFWRPWRAWFERRGDYKVWPFLSLREMKEEKSARRR